jgi:hypothetical protein
VKNPTILLAALAFASCAPPQATVIEEAPKRQEPAAPAEPGKPALADDGLRLPDMLTLPDENQLRSAAPLKEDGDATIIATPPTE